MMNSWAGNSYWNRFQKFMIQPSAPIQTTIETAICKKYLILSHILDVTLLWSVNSYLASFRSTPFHMTPFLAPAPEGPFVSTSPHFLPSRASRSQRLALAELVLVGASSVRFQLSAGRCRAGFAFPVRREDSMPNGIHRVKKIYSVLNIRGQKNTP